MDMISYNAASTTDGSETMETIKKAVEYACIYAFWVSAPIVYKWDIPPEHHHPD
jgi:hypothetical protein